MSRRARAIALAAAALACAALAAVLGESYARSATERFGPMTEVLVAAAAIERGTALTSPRARAALEVRRIPAAFVPADALADPAPTRGLRTMAPLPEGALVLGSQLGTPRGASEGGRESRRRLGGGRSPIRLAVAGLDPRLLAPGDGGPVDVVASGEGSHGKPRIVARGLRVLELSEPGGVQPGIGGERSAVTLSAGRRDALRLIAAEGRSATLHLLASKGR